MERINAPSITQYAEVENVAIAIKPVGKEQLHIGILHRNPIESEVSLLHLAWHFDLRSEVPSSPYSWITPRMPRLRAIQVAARCRQIAKSNIAGLPYAFSPPNDCFDEESGRSLLGSGAGLTCASFVLAVFKIAGVDLMELESWQPRSSDATWQQHVLDLLKSGGASEAHCQGTQAQIGSARYRPEEVAAAAILYPPPAGFEGTSQLGVQILDHLLETRK